MLKNGFILGILLCLLWVPSPALSQEQGEETEDATPPAILEPSQIYICIRQGNTYNLLDIEVTEPTGLTFARTVEVTVFSAPELPITTDLIQIIPDATTGTYGWNGTILENANTTTNIPVQDDCQAQYAEFIGPDFERTVEMPMSTDQALTIRQESQPMNYATPISGVIGIIFRDETDAPAGFPHFQLLRYEGSPDDVVSISLPDFEEETDLYVVSRQAVSYSNIDADGFESALESLDRRARFLNRLNQANGNEQRTFFTEIMARGNFRIYVEYGKEIFYEPGGILKLQRFGSYIPRQFSENTVIRPISCAVSNDGFDVPYYRPNDYDQYLYLPTPIDQNLVVGRSTCANQINIVGVTDTPDKGEVLVVTNGTEEYYIAAWLVELFVTTP